MTRCACALWLPLVVVTVAAALPRASAQGEPASDCFRRQLRSVDLQSCLLRERAAVERQVNRSLEELIAAVGRSRELSSDPVQAGAYRRMVVGALRRSQQQWRTLTTSECDVLAPALYVGGTIAPSAAVDCWISRLRQRLATLRGDDVYGPFWSR